MAKWRRTTLGSRAAQTVGDAYRSLADLCLSMPGVESGYRLPDNLLWCNTNGMTVAYGAQPSDLSTGPGATVQASAGVGVGFGDPERSWDMAEVWVRNTVAGSAAQVVVVGPVYVRWED